MTSTVPRDPVISAVTTALARIGPGLYGVACSGGADSLALAHAAIAVAGAAHVVVVTIDHDLQPGSAEVARAVAHWAIGQGAAARVRRVVVVPGASLEAAARTARYAALEDIADEVGLVAMLTGHTARDQAETVLMRIVRGTGPAGLAGIPARRGRFVRPLLALPRAAIDTYAAAHALPVWADPMNADTRLSRVRFRGGVLPALRAENPQLDAALLRLAASAAEWAEVIDARARPRGAFPIACAALAAEPAAIRKRALALALEAAGLRYDAGHLDRLDAVVTASPHGEVALDLPGGRLVRSYDALAPVAGVPAAGPALAAPPGPYLLRPWRPGDRMRPARLRGRSRKLADLFIDAKVPRASRATAQVLVRTSDGAIVWAEHLGRAADAPAEAVPRMHGAPVAGDGF